MASQSLYRKWRSQTFSDLIGQEAVTRTLLNAVREGRLAHAYLFCGPRGTGKTSAARLLAKAINCSNPHDGEPCNECVSCREITAGHSPDVIEIDAASNTGVDNIRDLRETVNLLGSAGRYKVYVIDEAHMLTTSAFNALLKTLEEPPPHVIFVLATTEAHKVLPTIVSRCQRFDFRRFSARMIVSRLLHVASGEGLELEPAAAELLARAAQGGMRDALSLLDQAVAFCGTHVDFERTRTMLGLADPATIRALLTYVAEQRSANGLHQIAALVESGADLRQAQLQLAEEWRALMLARAGADVAQVMDRSDEESRELAALAQRFSLDELMACARVFGRIEAPARGMPVPQLALELMFLECVAIRRNGGPPATVRPVAETAPAPPATQSTPAPAPVVPPRPSPAAMASPARAPLEPPAMEREELDLDAIVRGNDSSLPEAPPVRQAAAVPTTPPPPPPAAPTAAIPAAEPADAPLVQPAPIHARGTDDERLAEVQRQWPTIHKVCRNKGPKVHALLKDTALVQLEAGDPPVLVLQAKYKSHLEMLREPSSKAVVEWAIEQVLETRMKVRFMLAGTTDVRAQPGARTRATASTPATAPATPSAGMTGTPPTSAPPALPADPLSRNGVSANGHQGAQENGRRVHDDHLSYPSAPARAPGSPAASNGAAPDDIEAEVRADPLIQEILRATGAEIAEIRPLNGDDAE